MASTATSTSAVGERFQRRTANIGVIGLGYVGLPLTLVFHRAGFQVTGFDVDANKVRMLENGESYLKHIGAAAVAEARATGRYRSSTDFAGLGAMDAIVICVPTPLNAKREPDLSFVEETARSIAAHLRPDQLIVLESSTYPGTTEEVVLPILESSGVPCRAVQLTMAAAAGHGSSQSSSHSGGSAAAPAVADNPAGRAELANSP
ncbi:MAG: NAD(P)-binding domain-containing protein, partial [Terriglobales bacterium]